MSHLAKRNIAIDLFRALTMFVMIFVNDFWKIEDAPHMLDHAAFGEDFMGLADMVYPCFLFAVGLSIPYAMAARSAKGFSRFSTLKHVLSRSLALLVMGLFVTNSEYRLSADAPYSIGIYWILMVSAFILIWNSYPRGFAESRSGLVKLLKIVGWAILIYLAITFRSRDGGYFAAHWGILGSIGWAYLIVASIYLLSAARMRILLIALLLFIWVNVVSVPMREEYGGLAIIDIDGVNLFDQLRAMLYIGNGAGLSLVMGGVIFSLLVGRVEALKPKARICWFVVGVALLTLLAVVAHNFWIISKMSGTVTWVLAIFAISIGLYGALSFLVAKGCSSIFNVIKPAGVATLTCYMIPYIAYAFADMSGVVLPEWLRVEWMGILNCLCFSLVIIGVTALLGRVGVKLKV